MLESVARHCGFDIDTPFEALPREGAAGAAVRLGRRGHRVRLRSRGRGRRKEPHAAVKRAHPFEGILPNFERRYRETDSAAVREELARYQAAKPCADCDGTRLRREARHVFLQQGAAESPRAVPESTHRPRGRTRRAESRACE